MSMCIIICQTSDEKKQHKCMVLNAMAQIKLIQINWIFRSWSTVLITQNRGYSTFDEKKNYKCIQKQWRAKRHIGIFNWFVDRTHDSCNVNTFVPHLFWCCWCFLSMRPNDHLNWSDSIRKTSKNNCGADRSGTKMLKIAQ